MNYFYLHIPFCRQKCPYCKFALTPIFDDMKKRRYLEYLKREIRGYFSISSTNLLTNQPATIYFGGGTPSILTTTEVREILECFPEVPFLKELSEAKRKAEDFSWISQEKNPPYPPLQRGFPEISFECNPEDITEGYVRRLFDLGINRISLGVQSLNNTTLQSIHRSDRESIFHALDAIQSIYNRGKTIIGGSGVETVGVRGKIENGGAKRTSFSTTETFDTFGYKSMENDMKRNISINMDFILGLPFSKPGETLRNIQELHEKFPFITHTSVYMLEEGMYPKDWKKNSINEIEIEQEYAAICKHFESLGWNHYEISNWAKPEYESVHNRGYWNHTNYRGFGLSATSYEDGKRWENSTSFSHYYRGENISSEKLTPEQIELEEIIFGIRTFSLDAQIFPREIVEELTQEGAIKIEDERIILTPAGIFRENTIIAKLIEYIE
ncbi:MAG: radical SAM protein [Candidatus Gracilibacteria bacterium]|nr:radical SAM protein [Candidatus Gracilibacteria bacterium]